MGRYSLGIILYTSFHIMRLRLKHDLRMLTPCLQVTKCAPLQSPQMVWVYGAKVTASASKYRELEPMAVIQR